jgi:hypothetical protein
VKTIKREVVFLCFDMFKGMSHNPGLTEAEDVALYLKRDLYKRKTKRPPYEIVRDETVGR